jgi:DNA primase
MSGPIWDLIQPYLKDLKRSGSEDAKASCPFHDDVTPSFYINTKNGLWICHAGCGAGSLPKLLRLLGMSRDQAKELLEPIRHDIKSHAERRRLQNESRFRKDPFLGEHILPEDILGAYDYCPVYLTSRGFDPKLLRSYDVGYDQSLHRVTFPIRDLYGNLVGISGRSDDEGWPRYKFYQSRQVNSEGYSAPGDFGANFFDDFPGYTFDKRFYLWNSHEALPLILDAGVGDVLVIVEGFKACLWLIQCGHPTTVALMGSSMSQTQADIVRRVGVPIVLFLDNNSAGIKGAKQIQRRLLKTHTDVRTVTYPSWADTSYQPDDFSAKRVAQMVTCAKR